MKGADMKTVEMQNHCTVINVPQTCPRMRRWYRWLKSGAIALLLGLIILLGQPGPAQATIRKHQETPTQVLYQARQPLRDRDRNTWQAIAFKRVTTSSETALYLRLVGFPGRVDLDQTRSLTLRDTVGTVHQAETAINEVFTQGQPGPNVVQYRLTSVLPDLPPNAPQWMVLPTVDGSLIELKAPPIAIQEWRAIANCHSLTCSDPSWAVTPYRQPNAS
jgi:hypothetical protein